MDAELLNTLESQHRDAEDLLAQLEDATEASEQQPLVDKLVTAMAEHMAIEEEQVYPELQRIDGELAEEADVEHGLAREGLDKLQSMVGKPGFGAAVEMVKGGISHHVEDEETEAFPKLRKSLGLRPTPDRRPRKSCTSRPRRPASKVARRCRRTNSRKRSTRFEASKRH